jgi:hypothetical protein
MELREMASDFHELMYDDFRFLSSEILEIDETKVGSMSKGEWHA